MSIPDFHIVRTALEENMHRQFTHTPDDDLAEPAERQRASIPVAARLRMSAMLRGLANAIEPSGALRQPARCHQS